MMECVRGRGSVKVRMMVRVGVRVAECEGEGCESANLLGDPRLPEVQDAGYHQHGLRTKGLQFQTYSTM